MSSKNDIARAVYDVCEVAKSKSKSKPPTLLYISLSSIAYCNTPNP